MKKKIFDIVAILVFILIFAAMFIVFVQFRDIVSRSGRDSFFVSKIGYFLLLLLCFAIGIIVFRIKHKKDHWH